MTEQSDKFDWAAIAADLDAQ
ncbi:MAG: hypothetical protein JWO16_1525, partial [Sphingomonas bacterium]|nr:hypothetical protein [Sphingomonas bacterium]